MITPKHHIFICTSCRINGTQQGFCYQKGSVDLVQKFMEELDERDLSSECMITNTGCFGICDKGPIAVVYPEGLWYVHLDEAGVERIFEEHLENGEPVPDYFI